MKNSSFNYSKLNVVKSFFLTILLIVFPLNVQAATVFQSIWNSAIPLLDQFLEASDSQANLPEKKLFGDDRSSNLKKMNELKTSILEILLESELLNIWKKMQQLELGIESDKKEIASLREERITAPAKSLIPWQQDQKSIDKDIEILQDKIVATTKQIDNVKDELRTKLEGMGVILGQEQFDALLSTATSDEIIDIMALSDNIKAIVLQLVTFMKETGEDLQIARRYYGLYTALLEVYVFAYERFLQKLNNHYLPTIADIKREAKNTIRSALPLIGGLSSNMTGDRAILQANIEANKLTIRVADLYQRILIEQREGITKDKSKLERNLKVAKNTYQTVRISGRMVALVRTGLQEFELLGNIKPPDLRIFANVEMKREFERLTEKLKSAK
jgi:hypothetical protein